MLLVRQEIPFTLPTIFSIIYSLSQKQPEKYLKVEFTGAGIGISTLDDSGTIMLGIEIKKEVFQSYILEKNISLYFPVLKFDKILHLPTMNDDSITLTYQHDPDPKSTKQLNVRIHSKKNNQKLIVSMKVACEFGEMISEKYEQPANPIDYYNNLMKEYRAKMIGTLVFSNINPIICEFKIPSSQYMRICSEFMEVTDRIVIQYESQRKNNKKYLTFSTCYQPNAKSITLNEEKSIEQLEYEESEFYAFNANKIDISSVFPIQSLWKIGKFTTQSELLFNEDIGIVMENTKCLLVVHELVGDCGRVVSMVGPLQI